MSNTRRAFYFKGIEKTIEITKVVAINTSKCSFAFHLDLLDDGTCKLTYNSTLIPDFTKIEGIDLIRED